MHQSGKLEELEISNFLNLGLERKKIGIAELEEWKITASHQLMTNKDLIDSLFKRI